LALPGPVPRLCPHPSERDDCPASKSKKLLAPTLPVPATSDPSPEPVPGLAGHAAREPARSRCNGTAGRVEHRIHPKAVHWPKAACFPGLIHRVIKPEHLQFIDKATPRTTRGVLRPPIID